MAASRQCLVVLVTCPNRRQAKQLAHSVVRQRLAACVNLIPDVHSWFWWRGRLDQATEALLVMKTSVQRFARLRRIILAEHPYDVPEILALPIVNGHAPYLQWLLESLSAPRSPQRG